jgi:hypothetical protein
MHSSNPSLTCEERIKKKFITHSENGIFGIERRNQHLADFLWPVETPELVRIAQCDMGPHSISQDEGKIGLQLSSPLHTKIPRD